MVSSVYLDFHDQASGKDELHHNVSGTFRALSVGKRTATIQRGEVVELVFLDILYQ